MRSHGLFAQFDDELQDSDQTISPSVRRPQPRARLFAVADATNSSSSDRARPSRRRFPTSAFFSDTTDDDVSRPTSGLMDHSIGSYSRFSNRRRSKGWQNSASHGLRLRVDAVQFPVTRSVLWDRRRLSDTPVIVSLEHVLPQFSVSAEALKEIYKLCRENKRGTLHRSGAVLCFLHGEATSPRIKRVRLEGVKLKKEDACAAGTWCIPVYLVAAKNALGQTQENYVSTIASALNSYRDDYVDSLSSKLQPKLLVSQLSPHAAQLDFQLECVASPVLFEFSLIRNLPLLMTPLAASLSKREFSTQTGSLRSGYLTLDQTRKAVPLLKVDPLVSQQPLVGVWVYGVHIDDAWNEEAARRQLADPLLYFACIGYLMSETIKERVGPRMNTFLVALYPADNSDTDSTVGLLPRFFECAFSESLSLSTRLLPLELFSQRRSCFVGVSKFSSDLELTLSAAPTSEWKAAACQANIPAIVYTKEGESAGPCEPQLSACSTSRNSLPRSQNKSQCIDDEDEHKSMTRGWTVTSDAIRKTAVPDPDAQSQTGVQGEKETCNRTFVSDSETHTAMPPNALHDATCTQVAERIPCLTTPDKTNDAAQRDRVDKSPSNNRSCCKTQQLLTIQHQQILENQQRQLHEMQEQIVQMRRILNVTHNGTKRGVLSTSSADDGYVSDASTSGTGAVANVFNVTGTSSRHENHHLGSQFPVVSTTPRRSCNGSFLDEWSICTRDNDVDMQERGNKDLSLSSLSLSSISCDSAADLSSLPSSLVGEQHSAFSSTRNRKRTLDSEQVDVYTQALDQSQLPKSDTDAGNDNTAAAQVDDTNAEVDKSSGNEFDVHDGADSITGASNISVDKVDGDLDEQAFSIIGKSGMGSVGYNEDSPAKAVERLLLPDTYLRKVGGFVDHHGGCFTTPPLDFHSFCVPRIKFLSETPEFDSDDEEIRLIEQKYTRLMAASQR
uniref:STIL N-terminal domain-containing protein n=1 Tax=Peronospora matthiolae TaxID=2874970 RepID=A0AAV1TLR2_9STRA